MKRISFDSAQYGTIGGGWPQERYYSSDGETVAAFLSFRRVYEINPFEVGANHAKERACYSARYGVLDKLLDLAPLRRRAVMSLSNGELRRVILARVLLRESGTVLIDGGCGGLDEEWRGKLRAISPAMRGFGVRLRVAAEKDVRRATVCRAKDSAPRVEKSPRKMCGAKPVVEIENLDLSFGKRRLFKNLSWTVREGERWILRGPNGSGKTTLLALITGDSPYAYACDIKVFGSRRGKGEETLERMRKKIGEVSSARQSFLGVSPATQLKSAIHPGVKLLLLDEPCCDMSGDESREFARRVSTWLDAYPRAAAVWVEHRSERVPQDFSLVKELSPLRKRGDF